MTTLTPLRKLLCAAVLCFAFPAIVPVQATPAMREGDIDVGQGVRIHYVEAGDRNAAMRIVFIPGWCTSSAVWRDQMTRFAADTHVISLDPRSQGKSTITMQSNTPEQRAQDMRKVIATLGLKNVVLVGWSQGVQDVAAYAAASKGEGIAGYVLVDSIVGAGPADAVSRPEELKQQLERMAIYQQYPRQYLNGMMNAIIRSPEGRKRIDEYVAIGLNTPPDLGIGMLLMDFIAYDRRAALAAFNRPTLVIASSSADDVAAQRAMAGRIQDAEFRAIEDAGHAVFLDQPRRFGDLISVFLRGIAARTPA